jgi:hypothetical protein
MINNNIVKIIESKINSEKNNKKIVKKLYFLYSFLNKKCEKNEYFTSFFDKN